MTLWLCNYINYKSIYSQIEKKNNGNKYNKTLHKYLHHYRVVLA